MLRSAERQVDKEQSLVDLTSQTARALRWATIRLLLAGISTVVVGVASLRRSYLEMALDSTAHHGARKAAGKTGIGSRVVLMPPQLIHSDSVCTRRILSKTSVLTKPYIPSPWLGHRVRATPFTEPPVSSVTS